MRVTFLLKKKSNQKKTAQLVISVAVFSVQSSAF